MWKKVFIYLASLINKTIIELICTINYNKKKLIQVFVNFFYLKLLFFFYCQLKEESIKKK